VWGWPGGGGATPPPPHASPASQQLSDYS
jgi:hypothetical protein